MTQFKELLAKIREAEKNKPAVIIPKEEEIELEKLSNKKTAEIDSAINKALTTPAAAGQPGAQGQPATGAPGRPAAPGQPAASGQPAAPATP